jgi:hypothetical protein
MFVALLERLNEPREGVFRWREDAGVDLTGNGYKEQEVAILAFATLSKLPMEAFGTGKPASGRQRVGHTAGEGKDVGRNGEKADKGVRGSGNYKSRGKVAMKGAPGNRRKRS